MTFSADLSPNQWMIAPSLFGRFCVSCVRFRILALAGMVILSGTASARATFRLENRDCNAALRASCSGDRPIAKVLIRLGGCLAAGIVCSWCKRLCILFCVLCDTGVSSVLRFHVISLNRTVTMAATSFSINANVLMTFLRS